MMKAVMGSVFSVADTKFKPRVCSSLFIIAALVCSGYLIGCSYLSNNFTPVLPQLQMNGTSQKMSQNVECVMAVVGTPPIPVSPDPPDQKCKADCNNRRPVGTETLPKGILVSTSDLNMRHLWGPVADKMISKTSIGLLAITVGIKQKTIVNRIVEKFLADGFVVMLFHYDDVVDEWRDFGWNSHVIHVSAKNQTKWWFAKRFLHPDIVMEYDYIFMWDEDLGVENFHPREYVSIVKDEGLEVSQPALDSSKSDLHYPITARLKYSRVHRRYYSLKPNGRCNNTTSFPPCIGFVEMMAPVFSRAAWRCTWHMIQNDLIHAWGLDMQLSYCSQGDRKKNVGIVDSEYIVHMGIPTLGGEHVKKGLVDNRTEIRKRSFAEMKTFKKRWAKAVEEEDECWHDTY